MAALGGGAVSYERGTPVLARDRYRGAAAVLPFGGGHTPLGTAAVPVTERAVKV